VFNNTGIEPNNRLNPDSEKGTLFPAGQPNRYQGGKMSVLNPVAFILLMTGKEE